MAAAHRKEWKGNVFFIGDGFKSRTTFRSSRNLRDHCTVTCEVLSTGSFSVNGSATFIITPDDGEPSVSGQTSTSAYISLRERLVQAYDRLSLAEREGISRPPSRGGNCSGPLFFGFTKKEYLERHELELDASKQFGLYWRFKRHVAATEPPQSWTPYAINKALRRPAARTAERAQRAERSTPLRRRLDEAGHYVADGERAPGDALPRVALLPAADEAMVVDDPSVDDAYTYWTEDEDGAIVID